METKETWEGILPVDKPRGQTAFSLVRRLRNLLHVRKIGHAGTLDPFATGVMVMLIGKKYTQLSNSFLNSDKEYLACVCLGITTNTFDCEGQKLEHSALIPMLSDLNIVLRKFQGTIQQVPPMYSAKKLKGKKLYEYARQGIIVERQPVQVSVELEVISYAYPHLDLKVKCSKGTYIRSLAHDIGKELGCGGHLLSLQRIRSGDIRLKDCLNGYDLFERDFYPASINQYLTTKIIVKV
jgi:tRNA pseudouridine55 synthase